jgi:hypothetical protein
MADIPLRSSRGDVVMHSHALVRALVGAVTALTVYLYIQGAILLYDIYQLFRWAQELTDPLS